MPKTLIVNRGELAILNLPGRKGGDRAAGPWILREQRVIAIVWFEC